MNITKTLITISLLFFSQLLPPTSTLASERSSGVEWEILNNWKLQSKPIDLSYSLDGKFVYILTKDNFVHIFNSTGLKKGSIPVSAGTTSIDISPRGEKLFLIDSTKNTFTALDINFIKKINIKGSPYLGLNSAPVTVVVFTDYQ